MPAVLVLDVPEFQPLVTAAQGRADCAVRKLANGYWMILSDGPMEFGRKELGLKPAVWYGLFTGGLDGVIERFDRDSVRIVARPDAA